MESISLNGHIKLGLDFKFAKVPQFNEEEVWEEISKIKMNDVCWIRTSSDYDLNFGVANSIVITSDPIIKENYIEFDFVDFM